jgi:hypothetical protein
MLAPVPDERNFIKRNERVRTVVGDSLCGCLCQTLRRDLIAILEQTARQRALEHIHHHPRAETLPASDDGLQVFTQMGKELVRVVRTAPQRGYPPGLTHISRDNQIIRQIAHFRQTLSRADQTPQLVGMPRRPQPGVVGHHAIHRQLGRGKQPGIIDQFVHESGKRGHGRFLRDSRGSRRMRPRVREATTKVFKSSLPGHRVARRGHVAAPIARRYHALSRKVSYVLPFPERRHEIWIGPRGASPLSEPRL